jgi:ketosteroid isomerase-like protein
MHPNAELINRFYTAFSKRDAAGMNACYHPDVTFSDPVFTDLHGNRARGMWKLLCERGKDLTLKWDGISADDKTGAAHWEAWYSFSATGRKVHNIISAKFEFRDGLIWKHTDSFDLHRWAGQALGIVGKLLGGTKKLQNKIRATAAKGLSDFLNRP